MSVANDRDRGSSQGRSQFSAASRMGPGSSGMEEESLKGILRILRKRKYLIFKFTLGGLVLAVLVCLLLPNQYKSIATLLVDKQNSSGLDLGSISSLASAVSGEDELQVELQTHATVLSSNTTMLKVVQNMGLQKVPPYAVKPGLFGLNKRLKAEIGLPLEKAPATRERLLEMITRHLEVTPVDNTRLITVAFRDHDPQRAANISNAFVTTYIQEYLQTKFSATAQASDWLNGQLHFLQKQVEDSQRKLSDYEKKTGLSILLLGLGPDVGGGQGAGSSMGMTSHIPAVDRLAALNEELTAAEADRITKEAIYRLTQTKNPDVVLGLNNTSLVSTTTSAVFSSGNGLTALEALRAQETQLQAQIGDELTKYGAQNPHLIELQGQLQPLNAAIQDELGRIRDRAKNDYELAKQTEAGIRQSYDQQETEVNKLNDSTVELELLLGEAASSRMLYNDLYSKLQEASIQAGVSATNLSLVDPALAPATPFMPNWLLYPPGGIVAGLLLGLMGAFVWERLDDTLVTPDQVEIDAMFPLLSFIPLARDECGEKRSAKGSVSTADLMLDYPRGPIAEAYRTLRTAVLLSTVDSPIRTLLVTSPMVSEGKSFNAYSLGVAFAQSGTSTVIIDADMRKPRIHALFGSQQSPGLAEVLAGVVGSDGTLKRHPKVDNLYCLPAGDLPPNPAELLGSRRMESLLEEMRGRFNLVILDTPPVLMVTDPVLLSTKVDGSIIVIRSGKTTRQALKRASEILLRSAGRKLGIVVNGVDTRSVDYYYAYGYYGDNKYYSEEANHEKRGKP
jgi:succinoglycan biosynthesis transport protein ExoP